MTLTVVIFWMKWCKFFKQDTGLLAYDGRLDTDWKRIYLIWWTKSHISGESILSIPYWKGNSDE